MEDDIKRAFEDILEVGFHTGDWGGEKNDLYTENVIYQGRNIATAFLLKGPGIKAPKNKARELQIADCGQNGDQLVRLRHSPASLLIVQFIGPVSQAIIDDLEDKVRQMRAEGKEAYYCIINGQATAHILAAYGKLKPENTGKGSTDHSLP